MHRKNDNFNEDIHQYNVQRRLSERSFGVRGTSGLNQMDKRNNFIDSNDDVDTHGEITGDLLDTSSLEKGMPLRPKRADHDDHFSEANYRFGSNPYLDFDLYDKKPNGKVSYFDPLSTINTINYSNVTENTKILPKKESNNNMQSLSNANNSFTFDFLHNFTDNIKIRKSLILSPFSILQSFCLLYIGSKNRTEKELKDYFLLSGKNATYDALYKINKAMIESNSFSKLNIIYVRNNITLSEAYVSYISKIGNFVKYNPNNPQNETVKLNSLISKSTNGFIKNIIQPDTFNNKPMMLMVNTLYFDAHWKIPFVLSHTKPEIFNGIQKIKVMMMRQNDKYHKYFADSYNQILEMDYTDNAFAMGFILPKDQYGDVMITNEQFDYYVTHLKSTKITLLKIPRFKHESKYRIDNLFKKMGLTEIFTNADISDIVPPLNSIPVFISEIIHAAVIIVDETGTKAMGATSIMEEDSEDTTSKIINFIADHQFLYYIRYKPTNTLIFIGQYY